MSEKFPELDDVVDADGGASDFLAREKELLGDEFATDKDAELLQAARDAGDEDEEVRKFESEFPDVTGELQVPVVDDAEDDDFLEGQTNFNQPTFTSSFNSLSLNLEDSQAVKEWKERRDLEISKRDEIASAKAEDLKKEAEKSIDDFYENYNKKKEVGIEKTRKEEADFIDKRDSFVSSGTVWSRVVDLLLLKQDKRDTDRFKQLLIKLGKNENAPGAAGY